MYVSSFFLMLYLILYCEVRPNDVGVVYFFYPHKMTVFAMARLHTKSVNTHLLKKNQGWHPPWDDAQPYGLIFGSGCQSVTKSV